jgi:hypothetical protein
MSDTRALPRAPRNQRQYGSVSSWRPRLLWLARRFVLALLAIFSMTGLALAQSQSSPSPQPQQMPQSQQDPQTQQAPQATQPPKPQTAPRRIPVASVADAARNAKAKVDASGPQKVYTNDRVEELPLSGISIVGPPPPPPESAKPKPTPANDTAKLAAYWKARFTAAREKLAQDRKALPSLQTQLDIERVQEYTVDEDTGQVYSDTYMDLLYQIDTMKVTIQNDKQALSDLHDEFRHAGGQPGWIR